MSDNKVNGKLDFRNIKSTQFGSAQTNRLEFSELQSAKRVFNTNSILKDGYTNFIQTFNVENKLSKVEYFHATSPAIDEITYVSDVGGASSGNYYVLIDPLTKVTYSIYQVVSGVGSAPGVSDVEIPATYNNNDTAAVVKIANATALKTANIFKIEYELNLSPTIKAVYQSYGEATVIDTTNSNIIVNRLDQGEEYKVAEVELEYDAEGSVVWQNQTLKNATYDPYNAEFIFGQPSSLVDENGNSYGPTNPLFVQLSDGSISIGTVNAEIEVQLSRRDNNPDAGDVHDSVRLGNQDHELSYTVNDDVSKVAADVNILNKLIDVPHDDIEVTQYTADGDPEIIEIRESGNLKRTLTLSYNASGDFQRVVRT